MKPTPSDLRAFVATSAAEHTNGTTVDKIDSADDALIEIGDDFGFNETSSFFQDMKVYSPSQDADVDA